MSERRDAVGAGLRASPLEAFHEEEAIGKAYDARLLARLWDWIAPYRLEVGLVVLLAVPTVALQIAPTWIVASGIDDVIVPALGLEPRAEAGVRPGLSESLGRYLAWILHPPGAIHPIVWLAALYLAAMAASSLLQYVGALLVGRAGQSAMRDLRRDVFAHIQRLHVGFFDRYPVGRLVTRATNDVENVAEMFSAGIVLLVTDLLRMAAFASVLFLVDARLALFAFLVVPPLALVAIVFRFKVREAYRAVRVRIARINAYIQENVTGMKEVQLFTREERNLRTFDTFNAEHRDCWIRSIRYDSALFAMVELATRITVAVVIWQAAGTASAGTIYLFIDLMRQFFQPLRDLSAKYSVMQSSMASCERIFQLLDVAPAIQDPPAPRALVDRGRAERGRVEFDRVWFAYQGDDWVLRDVSFRVAPGEKAALVGATGAGKTTLINLLTRFYDVTRGRVLLDGVDLRELSQLELRRRVAMVLQDVFLFSGSVSHNIALGRGDVAPERIEAVARAVQAHRFVESLPEGYATPVRERGSNLSTGQRQLLSFARALAHGADVLVLDEATSSIDPETESLVRRGVHALLADRTALVIAHRLSTIRDVDRIHVLHHGRLVESGGHDELLDRGGVYHRLYQLQFQEQENRAAAAS